jgi:uncharacterized membrane protein YkvA (DUF1232 family)
MIDLLRVGFDELVSKDAITDALLRHAGDAPPEDVEQLAVVLEPYLRSVPDALATALGMSRDPHCGRAVSFATGSILAYVFDEEDLLPEASFGLIGMLDDAYLVHAFVGALTRMYPFAASSSSSYDTPAPHASEVVARLLPEGVAESLLRTCDDTVQVAQAFFPAGPGSGSGGQSVEPRIRVTGALAAHAQAART